jgi:hypothetical protein
MVLKFIKGLNERSLNIIIRILDIMIVIAIASLVMCLIFVITGNMARLPFMTSLGLVCLIIFLINAVVLITVLVILSICLFIDAVKRDGLIKLFKRHIKTFTLFFISLMVINYIKHKNLEWVKSLWPSFLVISSLFLKTEIGMLNKEIEKLNSLQAPLD